MFIATVVKPNGEKFKSDKNGLYPVLLDVISGNCPSKRALAGTIAANLNITPGKTYLFEYVEGEPHEFHGRQFNFKVIKEMNALEIIQSSKELGKANVFEISKVESKVTEEAFDTHKLEA